MSGNLYGLGVTNSGSFNTVYGVDAGNGGTSGTYDNCTLIGYRAGHWIVDGDDNTAVGSHALAFNDGFRNTAIGQAACRGSASNFIQPAAPTSASDNVCIGYTAGASLTTGSQNVFCGRNAGASCTTASLCTFIGLSAGNSSTTCDNCIIIGQGSNMVGSISRSISIGASNSINHSDCILLGGNITTVAASRLYIGSSASTITTTTTATAGTSGAPPAQVVGYLNVYLNGTEVKLPYYNV